jgi:hypothetical protein
LARFRSRSRPSVADCADAADLGTPERARHGGILIEDRTVTAGGAVARRGARVRFECRLDWYADKAHIDPRQYEAGKKYRALFHIAGGQPQMVAAYKEFLPSGESFLHMRTEARDALLIDPAWVILRPSRITPSRWDEA